jgi:hypothetical protein
MPLQKRNRVTIATTNPAAGSEHSYTFTEDALILSFVAALVTDANAANRQVHFTFEDSSGNVYARITAGGTHAASLTRQYSGLAVDFAAPAVADTNFVLPIGGNGLYVAKGDKVKTITTNKQAGDDWGAIAFLGERPL